MDGLHMEFTTVLLADDHTIVREGLRLFLESTGHYRVVADVGDGHAAVSMAQVYRPDIVIMDLSMPQLNGIEATRQIFENGVSTHVIMLSMHTSHADIMKAMQAGASGYVHKSSVSSEIITAIKTVLAGKNYFSPKLAIDRENILSSAEVFMEVRVHS